MAEIKEKLNIEDVCGQRGCFAYREGHCDCLSNTDFNGRACPFFKTMEQYEEGLRRTAVSKDDTPEDDFLAANKDLIAELDAMEAETRRIEQDGSKEEQSGDDGWDDEGGDDYADE